MADLNEGFAPDREGLLNKYTREKYKICATRDIIVEII